MNRRTSTEPENPLFKMVKKSQKRQDAVLVSSSRSSERNNELMAGGRGNALQCAD
jgi:hypothetical protein